MVCGEEIGFDHEVIRSGKPKTTLYRAINVEKGKAAWRAGMRDGYVLKGYLIRPTTKRPNDKMQDWDENSLEEVNRLCRENKRDIIAIRLHGGNSPIWDQGVWKKRDDVIASAKVCKAVCIYIYIT